MTISKPKRPFPTQERLHELFDIGWDEDGSVYFVEKANRWKAKKGQRTYGYDSVCNRGFPSEHTRTFLGVDGHVQQIAVFTYVFIYGDYDRSKYVIDHVDTNPNNNRPDNLRAITKSENLIRRAGRKNSTSQYKGVYWIKSLNKWAARITVDGKFKHIGVFTDEVTAARSFDEHSKYHHGEYAYLNFANE